MSLESQPGFELAAVQSKMARVAVGWGVRDLAKAAGVSANTVSRLEAGDQLKSATIAAIRAALEAAGVEFIEENGGGPGVRLRKDGEWVKAIAEGRRS